MAAKTGPFTDAAQKARDLISKLAAQLAKLKAEKAELETDATKGVSILEGAIKEGEKALVLLILLGSIALALYYAPGNQERQVAGAGFPKALVALT